MIYTTIESEGKMAEDEKKDEVHSFETGYWHRFRTKIEADKLFGRRITGAVLAEVLGYAVVLPEEGLKTYCPLGRSEDCSGKLIHKKDDGTRYTVCGLADTDTRSKCKVAEGGFFNGYLINSKS